MPPTRRGVRATRHLSLARPQPKAPARLQSRRRPLSLRAAPYRPGELPVALSVRLPGDLAERANTRARRCGLPVELWLRANVDAARALGVAAAATGTDRTLLAADVDREAREFEPAPTGDSALLEYRRLLLAGERASVTRVSFDGDVELLLPLEIIVAWRCAAAADGERPEAWVCAQLAAAPAQALRWEATAAACGARLAEWVYACSLRWIARRSVAPQPRT